ncbi:MAG: hypothetical protein E5X80_19270 [Mesorhizobium sp.]|uniref:hypothetical protein n=1 Tax=Mesorhizobium sp. TaxID=1871066 RepID=UPI000FE5F897|nr:hypothetical protein [Mesorhizobium sp.]RWM02332.1 MAG: hypothetical protein EOR71_28330 [Mesorhizobium sp.]TIO50323.1 MAG: hypothetical protein E5X78_22260 [Mesorhizobium sp.]TIO59018.1 MAG: hypothetical protein E5X79_18935 [Mesorhizobium sp.]TJV61994.1 MAG: hypothetical protein E5X80_19270 [Mesorhizobium sp.]
MNINADAPFAPAQLAREELLRFLSTGFAGSCCGETNEMLTYLERVASSEEPGKDAPATQRPVPWFRFRGLFSRLNLFPA